MAYDYEAAFRAIDARAPGPIGGCLGCFRCRAGDHGSCHGCSCGCDEALSNDQCPETCATWWQHRTAAPTGPEPRTDAAVGR